MHSIYANFDTALAASTVNSMGIAPAGPFYSDVQDMVELTGEWVSEGLAEDRLMMAFTGALPSEVWA